MADGTDEAFRALQQSLRSLFHENVGDFKIIVETPDGEQTLQVWEPLMRKRSEVFDAMLSHDFTESQEKALKLDGFNMSEVQSFFEFLYSGCAALQECNVAGVLALADKYQVPTLKQLCLSWVESHLSTENVGSLYLATLRHQGSGRVAEDCLLYIDLHAPKVLPHLHILPETEVDNILSRETLCISDGEIADVLVSWVEQSHKSPEGVTRLLRRHANIGMLDPRERAQLLPRLSAARLDDWGKQAAHAPSRAMNSPAVLASLRSEYDREKLGSPFLGYWVVVIPSAATLLPCQGCCTALASGACCHVLDMACGDSLAFFTPHRRVRPVSFGVASSAFDAVDGFRRCPMAFAASTDGSAWTTLVPDTSKCEPLPQRGGGDKTRLHFACRSTEAYRWFKIEAMSSVAFRCLDVEGVVLPY